MLIDLIIVALTIAVAAWGYFRGFSADGLALIGFGAGVVLGSRFAPLLLDGGLRDPGAPLVALPGALLLGAIIAAVLERFAFRVRRPLLRFSAVDGVAGALVTGCLGLVVVWALGAAAVRVDSFRDTVRDSSVIDNLNAVLPPAGPLLRARTEFAPLPVIAGPPARVGAANPKIKRDPQVKRAARSVVKVSAVACGHQVGGSGWIGRDGTVVTNAHLVAGSEDMRVQLEGGRLLNAKPVWYDADLDIAILRAPGIRGAPALRVAPSARAGTFSAVLGFPGGGRYVVRPARIGGTAKISGRRADKKLLERKVTSIRAIVRPGNSGGPVVDARGRVVTMVFAGQKPAEGAVAGHTAYGVPIADVRRALGRAGRPTDTGSCSEE